VKSKEKRAKSKEQRAKSKEQRAKSKEQRAKSKREKRKEKREKRNREKKKGPRFALYLRGGQVVIGALRLLVPAHGVVAGHVLRQLLHRGLYLLKLKLQSE
jgi:hypothetical protein